MNPAKNITIILPDGSPMELAPGSSAADVARKISQGLYEHALAARVNGDLYDLKRPLPEGAKVEIIKDSAPEAHEIILHSAAHVMAQAVKQLFPQAKVTIGPAIENRFYYDFDVEPPFSDEDLPRIEERMQAIIEQDIPVERKTLSRDEALKLFKKMGEEYKVEIIADIDEGETLSLYQQGDFMDLCRGPHVPSTGKIKAFKLLNVAGAYWRGDSSNKMLSRIYGTAFPSRKGLKKYLNFLKEAKRRDHRKIGKALELFEINEHIGPGLVLWHPKGATILQTIKEYWLNEHLQRGYQLVQSPHIGRAKLWETSGHLGFYRDAMFDAMKVEGDEYYVKPMNCPFHIQIYKSQTRSYRDLPIKYAELGTVYRYELSGVLHGLMRVRGFTQDDAHIICMPEQLDEEVEKLVQFSFVFLKTFGFKEFDVFVSTRPEKKYVGSESMWTEATNALESALQKLQVDYQIDAGEGTFYGPKIDLKIRDALNRSWQCTTIQFDFNLSERFDMEYVDRDGEQKQPYMIHRAILGSLERFIGVLIEHTVGDFPLWIAPVQAAIIPITDNQAEIAQDFGQFLAQAGIRQQLNLKSDTMGAKIREAELQKIPYMFILGEREASDHSVSVRRRKRGDQGAHSWKAALDMLKTEIQSKEET